VTPAPLAQVLDADARRLEGSSIAWSSYREKRRADFLVATVAELASGSELLDAGCGNGHVSERLARQGCAVTALDLSEVRLATMAGTATQLGGRLSVVQGSVGAMPFPERSFDIVVCSEVLEHVVSPPAVVGEVHRVLRNGGYAVITVPNSERVIWETCIHCGEPTPHSGHVRSLDAVELANLIHDAGLNIVRMEGLGCRVTLKPPGWRLTQRLQFRDWRRLDRLVIRVFPAEWLVAVARRPEE